MTPAALTSDAIKTKGPGAVASVELALSDSVLGLHLGTAGWLPGKGITEGPSERAWLLWPGTS